MSNLRTGPSKTIPGLVSFMDVRRKELLKQKGLKENKKKITVLTYSDDEIPNYLELGNEIEEVLKKLF